MKPFVVPDESERWQVVMSVLGRLAPEFSAAIAGSFHLVIFPEKMPATVLPSSFSPAIDAGDVVGDRDGSEDRRHLDGRSTTGRLASAISAGFKVESLPPKSTVFCVNCATPAPEPTAL